MDCKATVKRGGSARGGKTRGDSRAADHEMGGTEKYVPFGRVDEDSGQLHVTFGSSSKTSDFIVDSLYDWWNDTPMAERATIAHLQLKIDKGPASSGVRTQSLKRRVDFADHTGKPIQLQYYPPYHSTYHPSERCGGILEPHWNGTKLVDVDTMLSWAHRMTWKDLHPIGKLSRTVYQQGVSLSKKAMRAIEARLERNLLLPKEDILIRPA